MKVKLRRIDFYPDDFLVGVAGMSPAEGWVYWVICSLIYSSGAPVPEDDKRLASITGLRKDHMKRVCDALVSDAKVTRIDGGLMVDRCRKEIERAAERISKAHENGSKGGRPKDLAKPPGLKAKKLTTNNQQPTTNSIKRAVQIPEDWTPSEKDIYYANLKGVNGQNIGGIAEHFRDHHRSKGNAFKDVSAAWRNWIRNHKKFERPIGKHGKNGGLVAALSANLAELEIQDGPRDDRQGDGVSRTGISRGLGRGARPTLEIIDASDD